MNGEQGSVVRLRESAHLIRAGGLLDHERGGLRFRACGQIHGPNLPKSDQT